MLSKTWKTHAVLGALLVATMPVAAHHSIASQYDFDKEIAITGVLVRAHWIRPHSIMHLEETAADGTKQKWLFETAGLNRALSGQLRAAPSKGGLTPGRTYTMYGFKARNGKLMAFLKELKMPDGRVIVAWFGDPNG